jgi:hypothetical protein
MDRKQKKKTVYSQKKTDHYTVNSTDPSPRQGSNFPRPQRQELLDLAIVARSRGLDQLLLLPHALY